MHINDLLKLATDRGASDLHLKVGSHPVIRVDGRLLPLTSEKRLMQEDTIAMAFSIMSARQKQKFKDNFEIDMAYSVPGLGRFRCSVFQQRGTVGLVLRVIPVKILTIRDLLLPQVLEQIGAERRGLVLVTGTTGLSGKRTKTCWRTAARRGKRAPSTRAGSRRTGSRSGRRGCGGGTFARSSTRSTTDAPVEE